MGAGEDIPEVLNAVQLELLWACLCPENLFRDTNLIYSSRFCERTKAQ
jgi:hypothetical protein